MSLFYLLFLFPLIFAIGAVKTGFYPLKALVTLSCMGILMAANMFLDIGRGNLLFMFAAFSLSIVGDFFLSTRGDETGKKAHFFLQGIIFFFLAHGTYLLFFVSEGCLLSFLLFLLIIPLTLYFFIRLYPRLEELSMKIALYLYLTISCFSLALVLDYPGAGMAKICLIAGIGLILFSDLIIGETVFCKKQSWEKWILPTYYAAHMSLTLGLIL